MSTAAIITSSDPRLAYLNPTQVRAFVGDVWLDDVAAVCFSVSDDRRPFYGFKSTRFDAVGSGLTFVQGQIIVHYRYPGYLTRVIDRLANPKAPIYKKTTAGNSSVPISEKNTPSDIGAYIKEMAAKGPQFLKDIGKTLRDVYYTETQPHVTKSRRAATAQDEDDRLFDLRLVYGRIDARQIFRTTYTIHSVAITGQSQEISILGGSGDECLYEVYDFIARDVTGS